MLQSLWFQKAGNEECVSVREETDYEEKELMDKHGEVDVHYVQDCIGEYTIPSAESF